MKLRGALILFLCFFGSSLPQASAQEGTMKWHFVSRSQIIPALEKTRGNMRATYDVLLCAVRQGYSRTALGYYENVVAGHEFDASAKDSAAYAFAYDLCDGPRPWHWAFDNNLSAVKKSSRATAQLFRERAQRINSGSPEILVMTSFFGLYQGDLEERGQAYQSLMKATNRAPNWADAYFWLGVAACNYGLGYHTFIVRNEIDAQTKASYQAKIRRLGTVAMSSFDRAEKLDSGIRPYLFNERVIACEQVGTRKSARLIPIYAEAHIRALPSFAFWYKKRWGKDVDEWVEEKKMIASQVAKEATS